MKEKNKYKDAKEKDEKEMDDFIEKQLDQQKKDRQIYDHEHEQQDDKDTKATIQLVDKDKLVQEEIDKREKESSESFKISNPDEMLERIG